jgi:hypothetical protein
MIPEKLFLKHYPPESSVARIVFQVSSLPQVLSTRLTRPIHEAQLLAL